MTSHYVSHHLSYKAPDSTPLSVQVSIAQVDDGSALLLSYQPCSAASTQDKVVEDGRWRPDGRGTLP